MPQQRLTPKRRIILQQIIDIPHPVIFLPRTRALALSALLRVRDGRAVDARDRVERSADGHGLAGTEDM